MGAGEEPRRLAGLAGRFARWSPKGDLIAFSDKDALKVAHSDGSQAREIARLNTLLSENGAWSPMEGFFA